MAESSFPFDTGSTTEDGWAQMARLWAPDSVEAGYDGLLVVTALSGMQSQMASGNAWVHGFAYRNSATLAITHASSTGPGGQSRNDLVILRLDKSANTVTQQVLTGTFAVTPADPALTQNDATGIWEKILYRVNVVANAAAIGTITDMRGDLYSADTMPRGYLAEAVKGAGNVDCGASPTDVVSVTFPIVAGRRYRLTGYGNGSQITTGGNIANIRIVDDQTGSQLIIYSNALPVSTSLLSTGTAYFTATTTRSCTCKVQGFSAVGALRFAGAGSAWIFAEDMGI